MAIFSKLVLIAMTVTTVLTTAQPLMAEDSGPITAEMISQMLDTLEAEPPAGADFSCTPTLHFVYSKLGVNDAAQTPSKNLCDFTRSFDVHFYQTLRPFWTVTNQYGVLVKTIKSIDEFNASYNPRPILNKPTVPYFELLYLPSAPLAPQLPVWTHEVGHGVLQEALEKYFYNLVKNELIEHTLHPSADRIKWSAEYDKLETEIDEIEKKRSAATTEEGIKLMKQRSAVDFRMSVLHNWLEHSFNPINSPALPGYNELFADVFATLFHQDINAIGDSFEALGISNVDSDFRRFVPKRGVIAPEGWKEMEVHIIFTPARHFMGANILPKIKNPRLFIRKLARYIIKQLEKPDPSMYLKYEPFIAVVEKSTSSQQVFNIFKRAMTSSKISSSIYPDEIQRFCDWDLKQCKAQIIEQLKMGHAGVFQTSLDPEAANKKLIEDLPSLLK